MKYAGIDYGEQRIGVALSDDEGHIAFPRMVVENSRGVLSTLRALFAGEEVRHIVMGDGRRHDGEPNKIVEKLHAWGNALARDASLPVSYESERFTSQEASRPLVTTRGRTTRNARHRVRPKGNKDAIAAALILQRFLDKRHVIAESRP